MTTACASRIMRRTSDLTRRCVSRAPSLDRSSHVSPRPHPWRHPPPDQRRHGSSAHDWDRSCRATSTAASRRVDAWRSAPNSRPKKQAPLARPLSAEANPPAGLVVHSSTDDAQLLLPPRTGESSSAQRPTEMGTSPTTRLDTATRPPLPLPLACASGGPAWRAPRPTRFTTTAPQQRGRSPRAGRSSGGGSWVGATRRPSQRRCEARRSTATPARSASTTRAPP